MKVKSYNETYEVNVYRSAYINNNSLAIVLRETNDMPFATLTVNLAERLPKGYAYVDTNNCPFAEKFIAEYELGKPTGAYGYSGYCRYPLYVFDLGKIPEVE